MESKKNYNSPVMYIVKVESTQMMATSPSADDISYDTSVETDVEARGNEMSIWSDNIWDNQ